MAYARASCPRSCSLAACPPSIRACCPGRWCPSSCRWCPTSSCCPSSCSSSGLRIRLPLDQYIQLTAPVTKLADSPHSHITLIQHCNISITSIRLQCEGPHSLLVNLQWGFIESVILNEQMFFPLPVALVLSVSLCGSEC